MQDIQTPPARRRRRWPYVVLAVVVVVIVAPLAIATSRLNAIIESQKAKFVPQIEARLGRKVQIGAIDVKLFGLDVEVRDVSIGPDPKSPEETAPLFSLTRVAINVNATRTLFSFGKRPALDAVEVDGVTVNVVRFADGTTNVDRLMQRLAETAPPPEPEKPMDPSVKDSVRHARLERLRIADARFVFTDVSKPGAPAKVEISDFDLGGDGIGLQDSWSLALSAAVLRPEKNLEIAAKFGPAPASADGIGAPALSAVTVTMARTDIAPLLPFLGQAAGEAVTTLQAAALSADLAVESAGADPASATTSAKGNVVLAGLKFPKGQAFDARLDVDAKAALGKGDVDVARLSFALGQMGIDVQGKLFALNTAPRFEAFRVTSRALSFDTLASYYPDLSTGGVRLSGPFSIEATASGETGKQQFDSRIDLSAAAIVVPDLLHKPAGTTLALGARGTAVQDSLTLEKLELDVVDWRLLARGAVTNMKSETPAFDLTARTDAPTLGGVLRLLPPVAKAVPAAKPLGGSLTVDAAVKGTAKNLTATVRAALADLDVRVPDAWIKGSGDVRLQAAVKGEDIKADVVVDFDKLEAIYADVLRKTAGTPLSFKLNVDKRGTTMTNAFEAAIAGMKAHGNATLVQKGKAQSFDATVEAEPFSLSALLALSPGAQPPGIGNMRVGAKVHARGTTTAPETITVEIPQFTAAAGKSDLRGKLSFSNPDRPVVDLEASSKYLDLDDFLPPQPKSAAPKEQAPAKGKPAAKSEEDPLTKITGAARLTVERGRAERIDYQNLKTDLLLSKGRATAKALEVDVFGGHFSGSGTELSLAGERQPFAAKGKLSGIDMNAVLTRFANSPDLLRGRLNADLQLAGAGTEMVDLQKTLAGLLSGSVKGAEFVPGTLFGGLRAPLSKAVQVPGLSKLLGGTEAKLDPSYEKALGDVAGAMRFDGGAMHLTKPLTANTGGGPLSLDGRILLEGKADLTGTWTLSPAAASALAGNKVKLDQPLPVKLKITGPLGTPSVGIANLAEIARVYLTAYGKSAAGQALQDKAKTGAEAVAAKLGVKDKLPGGGVDNAAEEAKRKQEQARQQAAEAEQKARVEAERLRIEADAKRQAAEEEARRRADEAKQKAANKLKGLFGK